MHFTFRRTAIALSSLVIAGTAGAAQTTESGYSVSCTTQPGCTNTTSGASGNLAVGQFDNNQGVLVGATLSAGFSGGTVSYTSSRTGTASFSETVSFGGASLNSLTTTVAGTTGSSALASFAGTSAITNLSALLGTGTVNVGYSSSLTVTKGGGPSVSTGTANVSARDLNASISYDYLNHANASFAGGSDSNVLNLSAGTGFSVFALGSALDTTKLDGVSIGCSGDCSAFSLGFGNFQDLAAGDFLSGTTSFLGTLAGHTYNASYVLTFADDGAVGIGQQNNALTLNLTGVTAVPEAETYAMFMAGLLALGTVARRRRRQD